jgi:predicted Rdx family selenoprotein
LNERAGVDARIAPGKESQFDVLVDGQLVFSKHREGRYPDADEIPT